MSAIPRERHGVLVPYRRKNVNSSAGLAGVVVNEWAHCDLLSRLGLAGHLNHRAALTTLGLVAVVGAGVGFRPRGTRQSRAWRGRVRFAGLDPIDDQIDGDANLARRLTELEAFARAAELAARPDVSLVALIGVTSFVDAIAGVCARNSKTLVAADHPAGALWSLCGAADIVVELGIDCYAGLAKGCP